MAIDFTAPQNAHTYSARGAHHSWKEAVRALVEPAGARVVDIGCGGGIYSHEWLNLGAASVIGVDCSEPILQTASSAVTDERAAFVLADASATGLGTDSADIVFSRALVHHVQDLSAFAAEAARIARPGGWIIVQDRTLEDVRQPASGQHIRGHFFDLFPRLLEVEADRRPRHTDLAQALADATGHPVGTQRLWEVRAVHRSREDLLEDIRARKGRSILHELDDDELAALVGFLADELPDAPIEEADPWTLWTVRV